jgi:hypothetical protein
MLLQLAMLQPRCWLPHGQITSSWGALFVAMKLHSTSERTWFAVQASMTCFTCGIVTLLSACEEQHECSPMTSVAQDGARAASSNNYRAGMSHDQAPYTLQFCTYGLVAARRVACHLNITK